MLDDGFGSGAPERRRHARLANRLPFKVTDSLSTIVTETINISASGAYCEVSRYIAPMTKVNIILLLPQRQKDTKASSRVMRLEGVVVRTEKSGSSQDKFTIAVFFTRTKEADLKSIRRYVESQLPPG